LIPALVISRSAGISDPGRNNFSSRKPQRTGPARFAQKKSENFAFQKS
jgi:hypothetical protein